jgi:ribosomal protein S18 acetylase RimI-like enzyme
MALPPANPASSTWRRVPFSPEDVSWLVPFCRAHGSVSDPALLRRLLLDLTSAPSGVTIVTDAGQPALAATVVDRTENGADTANLEVLGVAGALPAAVFAELVVAPSVAFARGGKRRALHVSLHPALARVKRAEEVLRAAGFRPSYVWFAMRRPATAGPPPAAAPLPERWRWADLDAAGAPAAHAALLEMFRGQPGFNLSPVEHFCAVVASGVVRWRVLYDGPTIAGLVQVLPQPPAGELRTIGRAPRYRGLGLGPRLLAEGLRLSAAAGVAAIDLSVEAENAAALALYRQFGFEETERTPVLALPLR